MSARKASSLRKVSNCCQGFGYGGNISSQNNGVHYKYGRKRGNFETDYSEEIGNGVVLSSLRKRRKFAPRRPKLCNDLDEEGIIISRVPKLSKSRWVFDHDFDECGWVQKGGVVIKAEGVKERRWSRASGVIQKEELAGECVMRVNGDDCMKFGVSDHVKECVTLDLDDFDEGVEGGVSRGGRGIVPRGCRSVVEYENLGKINEGSYGVVYKARDKKSGEIVVLKKMKLGKGNEGFPVCYLREIKIHMLLNHPSIVNVREVVVDDGIDGFDNVYLVMDYVEHDLRALVKSRRRPFSQSEVKCLMLQLLEGVEYLHDNWVFHRDLKTANILFNNMGEVKICDFGLSCQYGSPLKPYTSMVVTLWYRAPELLLGAKEYSTAVDMWSVGCIIAELLTGKPLFEGKTEFEQIGKIFNLLGTPNDNIWEGYSKLPGVKLNSVHQPYNLLHKKFPCASFIGSPTLSNSGLDLLSRLLTYDPEKRITAKEALNHCWFQEVPLPNSKEFMPTFPPVL
ncbi:cyclin-dependent kinase G-2-like [Chenopodium quinoa]|uniref:cyclin-dependent kinase n=1 Tax=Chenopodium quinoa TaxID=63459 RepID=A0A803L4Y6_CHEQI|nr:cyclin-dependent kinase G-2-like [Chenopodium quinoa]